MQQSLFVQRGSEFVTGLKCTSCELCKNPKLKTNCMQGSGKPGATFMFVGHAPGVEDDGIGSPMTGSNGRLLRSLLIEAGFDLSDCYFSNLIKCATHGRQPTKTMWAACREHFLEEYRRIQPRFVVTLGGEALKFLTGQGGITRLVGKAVPSEWDPDVRIYPMRQPAAIMHAKGDDAYHLRRSIVRDLRGLLSRRALGDVAHQYDMEQELDYKIARTEAEAIEMLDELQQYDRLACDLETTNLGKPKAHDTILAVGFSFGKGVGRTFPFDVRGVSSYRWWSDEFLEGALKPRIRELLITKEIFGQNFIQYDQMWLRGKLGIDKLDLKYDTMHAHYCLDEEPGGHSLESQAMEYTSMSPWKTEFNPEDVEKLLTYTNKDVDATWRLREVIEPQLNDRQRWLLDNILIPLSHELFEIEYRGVNVDETQVEILEKYLQSRKDEVLASIKATEEVRRWELKNNKNFNPGSPNHIREVAVEFLRLPLEKKTKAGQYCMDKEVLESFDHVPLCGDVLEHRQLDKLQGTYVKGTRERLRDGKLHTSFGCTNTVTGRLVSSDPNLQTMPREDTAGKVLEDGNQIKRLFIPEDGFCLLQCDYAQAELRVIACLSNCKRMLEIFRSGDDIHTATAAAAGGIPIEEVTKALRNAAKRLNFGIIYGMHEETLIEAFVAAGNTRAAAEEFLRAHKREFHEVWTWMDEQERIIRSDGQQTTYFGRSRRYAYVDDRAVRQAYNFPVQSTASDITLLSIIRCARALRQGGYASRVILTVHDSIIFEIKLEEFWSATSLVCGIMEGVTFPWLSVPMVVDAEAGNSWGSLHPVDWKNQQFIEEK